MSEHITDFISAAVEDKPVMAVKAFSSAIEPKIQAALDAKRSEVFNTVFNQNKTEED